MVTEEDWNDIEQVKAEIKFIINSINSSRRMDAENKQLLSIIGTLLDRLNEQNRKQLEHLTAVESRLAALENSTSDSLT